MNPGVMVTVGIDAEYLLELYDTVGSHDPRVLIKKVEKPAEHAKKKRISPDGVCKSSLGSPYESISRIGSQGGV